MKKFLALYMGSEAKRSGPMPDQATIARGGKAWEQWGNDHQKAIVEMGGPLSKTKRVGPDGISDIRNLVAAFTVVEAETQEDAAKMFLNHPHFSIFPGDSVEIMEILPIPKF
jgi:hypothetical protein